MRAKRSSTTNNLINSKTFELNLRDLDERLHQFKKREIQLGVHCENYTGQCIKYKHL